MKHKRRRLLMLTFAAGMAGTAVGTTLALAGGSPQPLTRDQVYRKGMTLEEVAAVASGKPGALAPPCPDVATATRLKEENIPFGPCDLVPEKGAPVMIARPEDEPPPDPNQVVCPVVDLGKGLLEVRTRCGPGAEILDAALVEDDGEPCVDVSYVTERGGNPRRETLCEGDVPSGGGEPVRGPSNADEHGHGGE